MRYQKESIGAGGLQQRAKRYPLHPKPTRRALYDRCADTGDPRRVLHALGRPLPFLLLLLCKRKLLLEAHLGFRLFAELLLRGKSLPVGEVLLADCKRFASELIGQRGPGRS